MSIVAAAAGAAVISRPLLALRVTSAFSSHVCTAVGALTISGVGFGLAPYICRRAPLDSEQRNSLREDFCMLVGPPPTEEEGQPQQKVSSWQPSLRFLDLHNPFYFNGFTLATRAVFALYADATGTMTPTEFRCALHKMIDITLSWYGARQDAPVSPEAVAAAVRKTLDRVSDGAFRVIDLDNDGAIDATEFTGAVLLVLAVANGKAKSDSPLLSRLAFRIVDLSGGGVVRERDLVPWVELALKFQLAPPNAQLEDRGPWGMLNWLFGKRKLTAANLTRKWLHSADADGDGALSPSEFETLAPSLQIHEVVRKLATKFAI